MQFVLPPEMKVETTIKVDPENLPDQVVLPPLKIDRRDENGRFARGHNIGRPPKDEAERKYKARARELMNQYTIGQMKDLVKTGDFDRLHAWDSVIIRNILAAATQGGNELKILLDRVEGAVQKQEDETPKSDTTYNQTIVIKHYGS